MKTQFEQLMDELGNEVGTPLVPDANHACLVRFNESDVAVQMEADGPNGNIALGILLGKIPNNNFRERVFKAALSVNASPLSSIKGFLAFGEMTEQFYLCDILDMKYLNGPKLFKHALAMSRHAAIWIGSINLNKLPDLHVLGLYKL